MHQAPAQAGQPAPLIGGWYHQWQDSLNQRRMEKGYKGSSVWDFVSWSFVNPMIQQAQDEKRPYKEHDADWAIPLSSGPHELSAAFEAEFARQPVQGTGCGRWLNRTTRTLLVLHRRSLGACSFWVLAEVGVRLASPVLLRELLRGLVDNDAGDLPRSQQGKRLWLWAALLAVTGFLMAVVHHQLFWYGMHMGLTQRLQCIAAIYEKALRLNRASIASISSGHVVSLISTDVRRFDDAGPFYVFLWAAPLELGLVFLMVSLAIGVVPAVAGVAASLSIIPLQSLLVQYMGRLRRRTAACTDERVRLTSEVIQGALAMKLLAWEHAFEEQLSRIRSRETSHLISMQRIKACNMALWFLIAPLVAFVTFSVQHALGLSLDIPTTFYALSLLNLPKLYVANFFVTAVQATTELRVSLHRIDTFLAVEEPARAVHVTADAASVPAGTVILRGADFEWAAPRSVVLPSDGQGKEVAPSRTPSSLKSAGVVSRLYGLRFAVSPGELLGIAGEVGCGKSSLLQALLGEMQPAWPLDVTSFADPVPSALSELGPLMSGSVAYCAQVPWIVAGSVRDNIIFGSVWDEAWYSEVLHACCLVEDIAGLTGGDLTEIGERGINLSGGQKARVALARAVYCRPAVVLLDDPLSAVDPNVGQALFASAIGPNSLLRSATRLLVTHQRQFLPKCDRILVLRDGCVAALGTWPQTAALNLPELINGVLPSQLTLAKLDLGQLHSPQLHAADTDLQGDSQTCVADAPANVDILCRASASASQPDAPYAVLLDIGQGGGTALPTPIKPVDKAAQPLSAPGGVLVAEETRVSGSVTWAVYAQYCLFLGLLPTTLIAIGLVSGEGMYIASDWWLALWSRASPAAQSQSRYIWVYAILVGCVIVLSIGRAILFFESAMLAASRLHARMVHSVLRAPLSFFHQNPSGRIINRFSKDLGQTDDLLPTVSFDTFQCGFIVLGAFVLIAAAVPVVCPIFLPVFLLFYFFRDRYIASSREIKRWEAVTRSPVFAFFSATLQGLPTIRAYDAAQRFSASFLNLNSLNGTWYFAVLITARWVGFRLDIVSAITLAAGALLAVIMRNSLSPAILGLALSHVLQLTGLLQWMVRQSAEMENSMTSVERMLEYTHLPQEAPCMGEAPGLEPPPNWPRSGSLRFEHVWARYRPELGPVLCDVTFELKGGTTCGVVGRTGSGKSSLMLTLFRLIEQTHGTVYLDGVDTASIGLDALRKQLSIIPQDPVLFSGTLRSNLDPWDRFEDKALWESLKAVQLNVAVDLAGGLYTPMSEAGDNFSVGQRQLFCLARALLEDSLVLALDEATANVDRSTDALIQSAVRNFAHSNTRGERVLLVIAHRIETIMDADHLLVMSAGKIAEQGKPTVLASKLGGVFYQLAKASHRIQ